MAPEDRYMETLGNAGFSKALVLFACTIHRF
jgi:hypothetical protein